MEDVVLLVGLLLLEGTSTVGIAALALPLSLVSVPVSSSLFFADVEEASLDETAGFVVVDGLTASEGLVDLAETSVDALRLSSGLLVAALAGTAVFEVDAAACKLEQSADSLETGRTERGAPS